MARLEVEIIGDSSSLERSFAKSERSAKQFGRSVERAGRGAGVAAIGFRGLGRAVGFASASFLGGAGLVYAIRSTVAAAEEAQVVLGQTQNAVERSGISWDQYGQAIQQASLATAQLSGFDDERLLRTFSNLVRRTGDVNRALQLNALAADVARGRNISLEAASQLVLKASIGNVGALRRLGINIGKNATATQALDLLQRKYAGSAEAYGKTAAGAQDRFQVALQNLQETVGAQLLPAIAEYLNKGADWLNQSENQQRVANDVHQAITLVVGTLKTLKSILDAVNAVTGSTMNTVKLLAGAWVTFKALRLASTLTEIAGNLGLIGARAAEATGKVAILRARLIALVANPYTVTIAIVAIGAEIVARKIADLQKQTLAAQQRTFKQGDPLETILVPDLAKQIERLKRQGQTSTQILAALRKRLGGNTDQANKLIEEAFRFSTGVTPELNKRIQAKADAVAGAANDAIDKAARKGPTVEQRNTWFDAMISRQLGRVQDVTSARGQLAALNQISALLDQRIAVTKDITRKLNLEDQLRNVQRQQQAAREQISQGYIDALQIHVDWAGLTTTLSDDIAAERDVQREILGQIRQVGATASLVAQLNQSRLALATLQQQQQQQAQEEKRGWLDFAAERAGATKTIKDDVRAYRAIEKWLLGRIKQEGRTLDLVRDLWETRQKIKDLNKKDADPLANLQQVSSKKLAAILAAGTGLGTQGIRQLGMNISGAEIQPLHVHVNIDGREVGRAVTKDQARTSRRTARQTSGYRG